METSDAWWWAEDKGRPGVSGASPSRIFSHDPLFLICT
jgi:hypothetical protein